MKKRGRRGDPRKQSYWEALFRRWKESGQSVRAFCCAEGVRESAFYCWRRTLARRGQRVDAAGGVRSRARSAAPTSRSPQHGPTPSFLPVHVVAPASGFPTSGCPGVAEAGYPLAGRGVEIVLAQGRTVRVPPGFDRQTLAEVLAVLEAWPC